MLTGWLGMGKSVSMHPAPQHTRPHAFNSGMVPCKGEAANRSPLAVAPYSYIWSVTSSRIPTSLCTNRSQPGICNLAAIVLPPLNWQILWCVYNRSWVWLDRSWVKWQIPVALCKQVIFTFSHRCDLTVPNCRTTHTPFSAMEPFKLPWLWLQQLWNRFLDYFLPNSLWLA